MIGVSKTFGGSSILSSPALKNARKPCIYWVSGVFVLSRMIKSNHRSILFIVIENYNKRRRPTCTNLENLSFKTALIIGLFQVLSVVPGTSRSGSTIIGGILAGTSRTVAAEFTFFLGIPVMFGASLLKILKFGFSFTGTEMMILIVGMVVAFVVSIIAIKFLMGYIKKHDFKAFGWYRIALGILVLGYFIGKTLLGCK